MSESKSFYLSSQLNICNDLDVEEALKDVSTEKLLDLYHRIIIELNKKEREGKITLINK